MIRSNYSILPLHLAASEQTHRVRYREGAKVPLIKVPRNNIPFIQHRQANNQPQYYGFYEDRDYVGQMFLDIDGKSVPNPLGAHSNWYSVVPGDQFIITNLGGGFVYYFYQYSAKDENATVSITPVTPLAPEGVIYTITIGAGVSYLRFNISTDTSTFPVKDIVDMQKVVDMPVSGELREINTSQTIDLSAFLADENNTHTGGFKGYDLLSIKGLSPGLVPPGVYELTTTFEGQDLISDWFEVVPDETNLLKVTFYHQSPIIYGDGHMDYGNEYTPFIYLEADLVFPDYEYQFSQLQRGLASLDQLSLSEKLYRFNALLTEPTIDVLRTVPVHNFVTVEYEGRIYKADKFRMNSPDWVREGVAASVGFEFTTDTLTTTTGNGFSSLIGDYDPGDYNEDFYTEL